MVDENGSTSDKIYGMSMRHCLYKTEKWIHLFLYEGDESGSLAYHTQVSIQDLTNKANIVESSVQMVIFAKSQFQKFKQKICWIQSEIQYLSPKCILSNTSDVTASTVMKPIGISHGVWSDCQKIVLQRWSMQIFHLFIIYDEILWKYVLKMLTMTEKHWT